MDFNVYSPNSNPFFEMTLQLWVFFTNPQAFLLFFIILQLNQETGMTFPEIYVKWARFHLENLTRKLKGNNISIE